VNGYSGCDKVSLKLAHRIAEKLNVKKRIIC
jgi:hypothetical protein